MLILSEQTIFCQLLKAFQEVSLLYHFDPILPIRIETDASGFAITAIISQLYSDNNGQHPAAFWFYKLKLLELNYQTYNTELLAIVETFKYWKTYVESTNSPISVEVLSDYNNLKYFIKASTLNGRQAR